MIVIPIQFIIGLGLGTIGLCLLIIVYLTAWIHKTINKLRKKK